MNGNMRPLKGRKRIAQRGLAVFISSLIVGVLFSQTPFTPAGGSCLLSIMMLAWLFTGISLLVAMMDGNPFSCGAPSPESDELVVNAGRQFLAPHRRDY